MTTTMEQAREFHNDKRGAVMLMGLCMSCFLIGGLWFVIGIGDAIVYRDAMQEATDHAVFTSAVMHAKGMNFISACNLVMIALVAIHIIMGIIHDILLAACIIFFPSCPAWISYRNVWVNVSKALKYGCVGLHYLEMGASAGYPFIGAYKGYKVGGDYGTFGRKRDVTVITVSTSMAPGSAMNGIVNAMFKQKPAAKDDKGAKIPATNGYSPAKKHFLPVEAKKYDELCKRIARRGFDALLGMTGRNPSGKIMRVVRGIIGGALTCRYCNDLKGGCISTVTDSINKGNDGVDKENAERTQRNGNLKPGEKPEDISGKVDTTKGAGGTDSSQTPGGNLDPGLDSWWGADGPMLPWGGTFNGSPWQQIWGINWMPEYEDLQQNKVRLAERKYGQTKDTKSPFFVAQAEFYFDCTDEWGKYECNEDDNAGYQIKWRARLRQVALPQIGSLLSSFAFDFLKNSEGWKKVKDALKGALTKGNASASGGGLDTIIKILEGEVKGIFNGAGGVVDSGQNAASGYISDWLNITPYH
ncbi:MAG: hypothetical protein JST00_17260 [Deltaproteobacteria bacterium]|nr:hypothetical protein [Deltaproteobacteria bacterium]